MRYFFTAFILVAALVVGLAGFRGGLSRKPPLEVFPDMDRQFKLRPQAPSAMFIDERGSRLPVAGTLARGTPYQDIPLNTGRDRGATNWVEAIPLPVTAALLERGRERFEINCGPCHGFTAEGNGITKKYGMATVANLHDPRLVRMRDGEIFNTISRGKGLMSGYSDQISEVDRWAILAYVRALQRSRLGTTNDVSEPSRAELMRQRASTLSTNR